MCFNGDATWKGDSEGGLRFGSRTKRKEEGFSGKNELEWTSRVGHARYASLPAVGSAA